MKINPKYKLTYSGKYTKAIFICPECREIVTPLFDHIKGFYESNIGLLFVAECPKCFQLFSAHSVGYYKYFIESIKDGTNVHYK